MRAPDGKLADDAGALADYVATRFTMRAMAESVLAGYQDARRRKAALVSSDPVILAMPN